MNPAMTPSQACKDLVKGCEGCKLAAYPDSGGIPTIGRGHTRGVKLGDRITQEQADELFEQDLAEAGAAVNAAVHVPLTQGQFDALVSFAFNCKGWRESSLLRLVNAGNFVCAAKEFPRWVHAGGKVLPLPGLVARRAVEQKLFVG